jgi:hypothetical protein
MALGASSSHILKEEAVRGFSPVGVGLVIGLACDAGVLHSTLALPGSTDFLYGMRFYDPWPFLGISCFLATIAVLVSLIPAYTQSRKRTRWLAKGQVVGYSFGYRRQFALISANYAKLQVGMGLAGSLITPDYAYLS